jgi:hypothetical protein
MHRQKYHFFSCSSHFHGNHHSDHTAGNNSLPWKPSHRRKQPTPATQLRTQPTGNPDSLGLDHDPDHASGRGRAGSRPNPIQLGRIRPFCSGNSRIPSLPAVLARERPDPFHLGHSGRGTAGIRLFWPENEVADETGSDDGKRI